MPAIHDVAPDFQLPTQDGTPLKLSELRGRKVVLYFYPKGDVADYALRQLDSVGVVM